MRSPKDMGIIQIDITNACPHMCSNCTRFCGHHKKTFFMDFETFKKAVDSLDEFQNTVGIIGGEPTLHPEFEKFAEYIREKRVSKEVVPVIREPIPSMKDFIPKNLHGSYHGPRNKIGLWSSLYKNYYKHFETINDTFRLQLLNDHDNTCLHQALLMPRKELGISDEEWIKKRDACWVQNTWSATITPKGAFFCEVAGALDMLFDGPGGWEIEPNWWKRTPEEFGEQLQWCELCSGCLDVPQRISNDERDDMTPQIFERLKAMGSPKISKKKYFVHNPQNFDKSAYHTFTGGNEYIIAAGGLRTTNKNRDYYPKNFLQVTSQTLPFVLAMKKAQDWIILADNELNGQIAHIYFKDVVINPGCVYMTDNNVVVFNVNAKSLRELLKSNKNFLETKNIWNYYPPDKIVKVNLSEAFYEKSVADCLSEVPHGSKLVIFGADAFGRKLFERLINDPLYKLCGWVDTRNCGYPVLPADINLLNSVDYIIVAFQSKETCCQVEELLRNNGIDSKKILKLHL